jgi:hypothetical protein
MNIQGSIPRTRGAVCGVLLILLGLWGGLAPYAGPYFHFGFTPDKAWAYTSGRLYLSAIPGAAALLGGLLVLATRNRGVGAVGGVLGALGGAWFVAGSEFVADALKNTAISTGAPLPYAATFGSPVLRAYLERAALFTGLGLVILFVAALAVGRFSMLAAKDVDTDEDADAYYAGSAATPYAGQSAQYPPSTGSFRTVAGQFPAGQFAPSEPEAPGYSDTTTANYLPPESGR